MFLPVPNVKGSEFLIVEDEEILSVLLFSSLGEIETAGYDGFPIDNDDLVVRYLVGRVYPNRDPLVREEVSLCIFLSPLALVQDDINLHASFIGFEKGSGDVR